MSKQTTDDEIPALLGEVRARVRVISENLPTAVDPLAISKIAKTPYVALCFRESQAWRVEEFARSACDMFDRGDLVVGISNTRHAVESCAAIWYLKCLIESELKSGISTDLHKRIMRLEVGIKNRDDPKMPEAVNVLTMLGKADAEIPGVLSAYEKLSEIAHPNYYGSAAVFSQRDESTLITHFRKNLRDTSHSLKLGLNCLIGSLEMYVYAYNKVSDLIPEFAAACEKDIARQQA